jgi:hypothetical protein
MYGTLTSSAVDGESDSREPVRGFVSFSKYIVCITTPTAVFSRAHRYILYYICFRRHELKDCPLGTAFNHEELDTMIIRYNSPVARGYTESISKSSRFHSHSHLKSQRESIDYSCPRL